MKHGVVLITFPALCCVPFAHQGSSRIISDCTFIWRELDCMWQ